jgi:hypothetical protein
MPLLANGKAVSWITGLKVPQLLLTSPSGQKTALKDVLLHGLTAKSDKEIPGILQAVYGVSLEDGRQSFFATQKLLVENHPSTAFFEEQALESGISKENVARFVAMAGEKDVAQQRALLLDIVTSENKAYVEAVVGTTIKSLLAVGATPQEITELFMEETEGRITVKFSAETVASPANLTVTLMEQGAGNVTIAAEEPRNAADGGESDGGNPAPPPDGGDPAPPPDGSDPAPPPDGSDPAPPDDGNNGNGNGNGGGRGWLGFLRDLLWNMLGGASSGSTVGAAIGAAGGAVVGGAVGAAAGGVGAAPGAATGAAIGAAAGGIQGAISGAQAGFIYTLAGGVYNPLPDPDNPDADPNNSLCNQPGIDC